MEDTLCLHPELEAKLQTWMRTRDRPAVLLYGAPGVGKTTLAYRIFQQSNLKVVEFNASHTRSGSSFRKTILPLLSQGGVLAQMNTGKRGGIGILLDEIDGLSSGEKGGLSELIAYLRDWTPNSTGNPLVLISNSLDNRSLLSISKHCLTLEVGPASRTIVEDWLHCKLPPTWEQGVDLCGDLRSLQRFVSGLEKEQIYKEVPDGVLAIAWWCLWNPWDPWVDLDIDNNEGNLAGLVCIENLPERLSASDGTPHELWLKYISYFETLDISNKADYWAFFYQCWNLLPFSHNLKLKNLGMHLSQECPLLESATIPQLSSLRYTSVLTRQSGMFNAWKLLCELADKHNIPIRLSSMAGKLEILATEKTLKTDRRRRLTNLLLTEETMKTLLTK